MGYLALLFNFPLLPSYLSLVANALALLWWLKHEQPIIPCVLFNSRDGICITVLLMTLLLFSSGIIRFNNSSPESGMHETSLPLVGKNIDNVNLYSMYNGVVNEKGYIYTSKNPIWKNNGYPSTRYMQGSQLFAATLVWFFHGKFFSSDSLTSLNNAFNFSYILFYCFFAYFFTRVFTNLSQTYSRQKIVLVLLPILSIVTLFIFYRFYFALLMIGFVSYIAALVVFTAMLDMLTDQETLPKSTLFWCSIFNVTIAACWFFLSPVALAISACALVLQKAKMKQWLVLCFSFVMVLVQIALTSGLQISGVKALAGVVNFDGGVGRISNTFLCILFVIGIIQSLTLWKTKSKKTTILVTAAIFSIGFCLVVYCYQIYTSGVATYYFYKSKYTITIPLFILVLLFLEKTLTYLFDKIQTIVNKKDVKKILLVNSVAVMLTLSLACLLSTVLFMTKINQKSVGLFLQMLLLGLAILLVCGVALLILKGICNVTISKTAITVVFCLLVFQITGMVLLDETEITGEIKPLYSRVVSGAYINYSYEEFLRLKEFQQVVDLNPSANFFTLDSSDSNFLLQAYYLDANILNTYHEIGWVIAKPIDNEFLRRLAAYIEAHPEKQFILYNIKNTINEDTESAFIELQKQGKLCIITP